MTHGVDEPQNDSIADAAELIDLTAGVIKIQVLHALAALHVADHLDGGPRTAAQVAADEGSHPRATYRLMRAAAGLGVLNYEGDGRFGLTGRGRLLRTGVPGSMRSFVLVQAGRSHWQPWGLFPDAVRQGVSQSRAALGADTFEYFSKPENAGEAALFAEAMADLSGLVTQGAVAAVDTTGVSTVVDVGGADGQFVLALLAGDPALRGQVLDLPHAAERAGKEAARRGLSDRFSGVAGDFFTEVPAADLYLLKTVLHDWDDEQCANILRNCRAAVHDGGRAVIVETIVGEIGKPDFATLSDMGMLAVTNGMERDLDEFDALFASSGWRRDKTYPVGGGYFGIEIIPG
ncbi:methyltransferase [Nocardia alni]|uniref:methyltransferase n=1 Tax=Nocardia alni TaxID=2815723 RepID=UPI001C24DDF0|nr:methyltransferase [Nocardia alni]